MQKYNELDTLTPCGILLHFFDQKQQIQQQLEDSKAVIEQASGELNREVSKLTDAQAD